MVTSSHRQHFGPRFSEGARLLWVRLPKLAREWGVPSSSVREELTRRLGASRGTVSKYLYGDRRPGRVHAASLRSLAGIPDGAWDEGPKRPFDLPAMAA